jgi:hypothetical protein
MWRKVWVWVVLRGNMNFGGFSWKRLLDISAFKSRISRKIGIPLTASGRRRKLGASIFDLLGGGLGTVAVGAAAAGARRQQQPKGRLVRVSEIQAIQAEAAKQGAREGWTGALVF